VHVAAAVVLYTLMVCSFPAWAGAWSPPARFMAVVLPMLAGYIAVAMQRVHRVVVFALAGSAMIYAGALTTSAVFTPEGGFSAQRGESPTLVSLGALTHLQLASWVPSAAINGQRMMFAAWMAAAIGLGVVVRLLDRERIVHPGAEEPRR
jgi:hypothetical protein